MSFRDEVEAAQARADAAEQEAARLRRELEELRSGRTDAWNAAAVPLAFAGIGGNVLAVDRQSGAVRWQTKLVGSGAVLVVFEHDVLLASTRGEVFRLEPETGKILWHDRLKGLGYSMPSLLLVPPGRDPAETLFIGIGGKVLALSVESGAERWRAKLKSSSFVSLALTGADLFASTYGELWCLDARAGTVRWHDPLRGLGLGLVCVGSTSVSSLGNQLEEERREQARKAAAAT